jgi:DNA-binding NarL/FixJ family response regulator
LPNHDLRPHHENVNSVRRALIVEDEQEFQIVLSDALDCIPGNWRVYCYSRGSDAISFITALNDKLDLALIDLGLPDMDGTKVISELRACFPEVPILVVSVITSSQKLMDALQAGASGYILKDDEIFDVASSINQVLKGHSPVSTIMARRLIELVPRAPAGSQVSNFSLSKRETELLECIVKGLSYAEAADVMNLKITTVHSYSRILFRKLGVHSQRQALTLARQYRLVST